MSVRCVSLLVVAVVVGCAQPGGTRASAMPPLQREADHITATEILAARVDALNAYDVIARLRPQWLHSHGSSSVLRKGTEHARVFIDGQQYGDVNSLRTIPGGDVGRIRYYNSSEAASRFGLRAGTTGVIEVRIRDGPYPERENGDE